MPLRFNYIPADRFYISGPKAVAEAMAADLAKAGIVTELYTPGDWATYLGERRNGTLVGLYMLGWGGDNGDPDNFTGYFFSGAPSRSPAKAGTRIRNWPSCCQLAVTLPTQAEREPLYKQADQILHDEDRPHLAGAPGYPDPALRQGQRLPAAGCGCRQLQSGSDQSIASRHFI